MMTSASPPLQACVAQLVWYFGSLIRLLRKLIVKVWLLGSVSSSGSSSVRTGGNLFFCLKPAPLASGFLNLFSVEPMVLVGVANLATLACIRFAFKYRHPR
jgi:hypothetical protein